MAHVIRSTKILTPTNPKVLRQPVRVHGAQVADVDLAVALTRGQDASVPARGGGAGQPAPNAYASGLETRVPSAVVGGSAGKFASLSLIPARHNRHSARAAGPLRRALCSRACGLPLRKPRAYRPKPDIDSWKVLRKESAVNSKIVVTCYAYLRPKKPTCYSPAFPAQPPLPPRRQSV